MRVEQGVEEDKVDYLEEVVTQLELHKYCEIRAIVLRIY
jgi:hypothetical protein